MTWKKYLGLALILLALYGAGVGTGAALWYGHVQSQIVTVAERAKDASDAVLPALHGELIKLERDKTPVAEELKNVSDNPMCNLSRGAVSLLNRARTGVSDAAAIADAEKQAASSLTQRAEAEAHAECAIAYRDLAARHDALIDVLNRTRGKR